MSLILYLVAIDDFLLFHGLIYVCKLFLAFSITLQAWIQLLSPCTLILLSRIPQILLQPCYPGLDLLLYKLVFVVVKEEPVSVKN
jgi:hypothetical protein